MPAVDNREIIRRAVEAFNSQNMEAMSEFYASTVVGHSMYDAVDPLTGEKVGYDNEFSQEEAEKFVAFEREMFPEAHTTIDEMFEIGDDKVLTISTTTQTHKSGKKVTSKGMGIDRIADGKIVETWYSWDRLGYYQQMGLVPPTIELVAKLREL